MSEYTNYFAVKSSSQNEVQAILNAAKIRSIVDADTNDYGFSESYKRNGSYNWVTVSAPADKGFAEGGSYYYKDQFDPIAAVFETIAYFFQDENFSDWRIKVKTGNQMIEKEFTDNSNTVFSEEEKALFSKCFDKDFSAFSHLLQAGKADDFLNAVGIPYLEMEDQDMLSDSIFSGKYSLLVNELSGI